MQSMPVIPKVSFSEQMVEKKLTGKPRFSRKTDGLVVVVYQCHCLSQAMSGSVTIRVGVMPKC